MILAIVGPTGVGKTKLSIELAKKYNAIIINNDAMQVYREMNIGTAKASEEEQSEFLTKVSDYDKNNAILAIISNKEKVENNVFGAYMKINP